MNETTAGAEAPTIESGSSRLTFTAGSLLLAGLIAFAWAAPSSYEIYKLFHVLAAVVWVGGGTALTLRAITAERANDSQEFATLARQAAWLGTRIFTPASFVTLAMGIAMVEKGDLGWGQFWIVAGLVAWAITSATGMFFLTPKVKQLDAAVTEHGATSPQAQAIIRRIMGVLRFDIAMLLLVVADMSAKPFA